MNCLPKFRIEGFPFNKFNNMIDAINELIKNGGGGTVKFKSDKYKDANGNTIIETDHEKNMVKFRSHGDTKIQATPDEFKIRNQNETAFAIKEDGSISIGDGNISICKADDEMRFYYERGGIISMTMHKLGIKHTKQIDIKNDSGQIKIEGGDTNITNIDKISINANKINLARMILIRTPSDPEFEEYGILNIKNRVAGDDIIRLTDETLTLNVHLAFDEMNVAAESDIILHTKNDLMINIKNPNGAFYLTIDNKYLKLDKAKLQKLIDLLA